MISPPKLKTRRAVDTHKTRCDMCDSLSNFTAQKPINVLIFPQQQWLEEYLTSKTFNFAAA